MSRIITVSRQFGSGGRELGRRLAEELKIEYYDKEIVTEIAGHTALSEDYVKEIVECTPHNLYPITVGHSFAYLESPAFQNTQSVYKAQKEIILSLAEKSDCVIVGRCADFILRDKDPYKIFVYADIESRMARCRSRSTKAEEYDDKALKKMTNKIDKNRRSYYEFYTGNKWDDILNYNMCINTTDTDIKEFVSVIAKMFK